MLRLTEKLCKKKDTSALEKSIKIQEANIGRLKCVIIIVVKQIYCILNSHQIKIIFQCTAY